MKKFSWIDIIIVVLFLLSVYLILTRIFGNSASDLSIMISLVSLFVSIMFRLFYFVYALNREVGEFKVKSIGSFSKIKDDIGILKNGINLITNDLFKIKKKLGV